MGRHSPGTPSRLQGQQGLGLHFGQEAQCLLPGPVDPAPQGSPENRGEGSGKIAEVVLTDRGLSSCQALSWADTGVLSTLFPSPQQPEGDLSQDTHVPLLTAFHSSSLRKWEILLVAHRPCTTCPITSCPLCLPLIPLLPSFQPQRSHCFLQHAVYTPAPGPLHMLSLCLKQSSPIYPHGSFFGSLRSQLKCHLLRRPSLTSSFQRLSPYSSFSVLFITTDSLSPQLEHKHQEEEDIMP